MSDDSEEKIENTIERFATWLSETGKTTPTVAKYIHYLEVIERAYGCAINDLVRSEEAFDNALRRFDERVSGTSGSLKTYKTALRAYRDFMHKDFELSHVRAVQLFDPDDQGKKWYREFVVEDKGCLSSLISLWNCVQGDESAHKWIFRGQGYAYWGLETSLGRVAYKGSEFRRMGVELKQHENDSLWEFYREASKDLEIRDFQELNLLALMQHYGCKTRLLDFSLSPLVAIYMALDQNEVDTSKARGYANAYRSFTGQDTAFDITGIPMALWAIDLNVLNATGCRWQVFAQNSFGYGAKIVQNSTNWCKAGITVVFPTMCNRRVSAQDGLFLMPNNLDLSFEENLCAGLGLGKHFFVRENLPRISDLRQYLQSGITKFVISAGLKDEIKRTLADANVSAKTVYPDLIGLGKYVGQMMF